MALLTTIATVGTLAAEFGPSVLRGIASLFGGKTKDVAEDIADGVETIEKAFKDPAQKQQKIENLLAELPPEALVELEKIKVELEREKNRRLELELNDQQTEHHETQTTIRAGDQAEDEYVRRTRPKGARISLYSSVAYVFLFELLSAFSKGDGADAYILGVLIGPFLAYQGWRTADKFSHASTIKAKVKQGLNPVLSTLSRGTK